MTSYFLHPTIAAEACLVVPIERVDIESGGAAGARWLFARRAIHAFVISDVTGLRAMGPAGETLSLRQLVGQVPGLAEQAQILRQDLAEAQVWHARDTVAARAAGERKGMALAEVEDR
jgi:hypothetical protein